MGIQAQYGLRHRRRRRRRRVLLRSICHHVTDLDNLVGLLVLFVRAPDHEQLRGLAIALKVVSGEASVVLTELITMASKLRTVTDKEAQAQPTPVPGRPRPRTRQIRR